MNELGPVTRTEIAERNAREFAELLANTRAELIRDSVLHRSMVAGIAIALSERGYGDLLK